MCANDALRVLGETYEDVGREDSNAEEVNQENYILGGLSLILQGRSRI